MKAEEGFERIEPGEMFRREQKVRSEFWDKFRRFAGRVPFASDLLAAYYCALDQDTPTRVRGMLLGAIVYFILPTDLVSDMIVGLGFTDDAAVLASVFGLVASHIKPTHRHAAEQALSMDQEPARGG